MITIIQLRAAAVSLTTIGRRGPQGPQGVPGQDTELTAADRLQTGLDVVATAADRVQTGLDAVATAADRVQTGLDAVATAGDRVQTGLDVIAAAAALDAFDDRYLGAKAVAPAVDNDGGALITGALYWHTGTAKMMVWNGSAWIAVGYPTAQAIATAIDADVVAEATLLAALAIPSLIPDHVALADPHPLQQAQIVGLLQAALDIAGVAGRGQASLVATVYAALEAQDAATADSIGAVPALVGALQAAIDIAGTAAREIRGGRVHLTGGSAADPALRIGTAGIYSSAADTLSVAIAGVERLRVTAAGITVYGTVTTA